MKKNVQKVLALILTALILSSCCSLLATAATKDTVVQYGKAGGYLAIDDSIARGCGSEGFYIGLNGE